MSSVGVLMWVGVCMWVAERGMGAGIVVVATQLIHGHNRTIGDFFTFNHFHWAFRFQTPYFWFFFYQYFSLK